MEEKINQNNNFKEFIPVTLTLLSTLIAVVYAIFVFFANIYYIGYFKSMNIEYDITYLSYDKLFYKSILSIILSICFYFIIINFFNLCEIVFNKTKSQKQIFKFIKYFFIISLFILIYFLILLIFIFLFVGIFNIDSVYFHLNIFILTMIYSFIIFILYVYKNNDIDKFRYLIKENIYKILGIFSVFLLLFTITVYCSGYNKMKNEKRSLSIYNNQYVVTYINDDYFILHKISIEDNILKIYKNKQKIIKIEDCEYEIMEFKDVVLLE